MARRGFGVVFWGFFFHIPFTREFFCVCEGRNFLVFFFFWRSRGKCRVRGGRGVGGGRPQCSVGARRRRSSRLVGPFRFRFQIISKKKKKKKKSFGCFRLSADRVSPTRRSGFKKKKRRKKKKKKKPTRSFQRPASTVSLRHFEVMDRSGGTFLFLLQFLCCFGKQSDVPSFVFVFTEFLFSSFTWSPRRLLLLSS